VGGTKKVNYRKIKELQPDIIICNKEENTQEMVERLREICPVLRLILLQ
jgi:ABC-type Fe3+-hydroxamate transport system substrate-binding protein